MTDASPPVVLPPPATSAEGIRSLLKGCGLLLAILLVTILLVRLAAELYVQHKESEVEEGWAALGMALPSMESRFPVQPTNPSALELERLAAELGIALVPAHARHPARTPGEDSERFRRVRPGLTEYVRNQMLADEDILLNPPAEVASYLAENEVRIERVVRLLETREPPRWEFWGFQVENPAPNLAGHLQLQRVLAAAAIARVRERRRGEAVRLLRVADDLNRGLFDRPEQVSVLAGLDLARIHVGVLRRLVEGDPAEWLARFDRTPPLPLYLATLRTQSQAESEYVRSTRLGEDMFPPKVWLLRPYPRLGRVNAELATQSVVSRLRAWPRCRWFQAESIDLWNPNFPVLRGKTVELGWPPGSHDTSERILRLELARELTIVILQARHGEASSETPSRVCPEARWKLESEEDGHVRISLDRSPPIWSIPHSDMPRTYRLQPLLPRAPAL